MNGGAPTAAPPAVAAPTPVPPPAATAASSAAAMAKGGKKVKGARQTEKDDGAAGDEGCVVCLDAPVQVTLFPCGHNITCASCTRALLQLKRPCPFCSSPIKTTDLERLPEAWRTVS